MEIIAEIGQNHNGDLGLAKELIQVAKECGADVAKFQLYDAVALFPKEENPWYEYNCKTEISRKDLDTLVQECDRVGIEFMSSVFDVERLGWLEEVGVKRHKVASRSIFDHELIDALVATNKRLLVSLGMWGKESFPEIEAPGGVDYLYCVSKYPTELSDLKFSEVSYEHYAGFSDHTIGVVAAEIAMARGARIIEKHFTLDKTMYGPDHEGSMLPGELRELVAFQAAIKEAD